MSLTNLEKTVLEYQTAGQAWIDAKLKADQLDEDQKSVLADLMNGFEESAKGQKVSEAKLDRQARATKAYRDYIANMCFARADMLKKKVRFDSLGMLFSARQSERAFERETIKKGIFDQGGSHVRK